MKILVCLSVMALTLACCKSGEKTVYPSRGYVVTEPVVSEVREVVRDTMATGEERPERREKTMTPPARYCIIVGSFVYRENAQHLYSEMLHLGFRGSGVLRNSEGMYRVSVACMNDLPEAQAELNRIRCRYPRFRDAWLLRVGGGE